MQIQEIIGIYNVYHMSQQPTYEAKKQQVQKNTLKREKKHTRHVKSNARKKLLG